MLFWIALLLSIRALLIGIFEKHSTLNRLFVFTCFFFFALLALILFKITVIQLDFASILIASSIVGLSIIFRFYGLFQHSRLLKLFKSSFLTLFLTLSALTLLFSGFTKLGHNTEVIQLTLSGKKQKKWVEWKNPGEDYHSGFLDCYEVVLQTPNSKFHPRFYIYGDLIAIRVKTIQLPPLLNFFGIPNVCHVESIHNGYRSMNRYLQLPHLGYPILDNTLVFSWIWDLLFNTALLQKIGIIANLESNYQPLCDAKGNGISRLYRYTIGTSGILAITD